MYKRQVVIAREAASWVSDKIRYDSGLAQKIWAGEVPTQSALETLERREGTCSEYTNLSVSYTHLDVYKRQVLDYMDSLAGQMQNCPADVLAVTNEVGSGVVPEHFLGRLYRDLAGKTNQLVAARADEVWLTVCGIAKRFK